MGDWRYSELHCVYVLGVPNAHEQIGSSFLFLWAVAHDRSSSQRVCSKTMPQVGFCCWRPSSVCTEYGKDRPLHLLVLIEVHVQCFCILPAGHEETVAGNGSDMIEACMSCMAYHVTNSFNFTGSSP